jgi:hypothetical protein
LVQVKKGKDDDASGTAYLLARLQELGTSPPEGLKTPQQVDVESLPAEALKSLPGGRVATALKELINVLLPATPWRAIVEKADDASSVVVTVTRNGSVVRTALVDAGRFLPTSAGDSPGASSGAENDKKDSATTKADAGDLLTAAAAVVLTELSRVHVQLTKGLCGATGWESVAAHVVATKPPATPGGPDLRRELLAYAVQTDPSNALAQMAYANLQAENASTPGDLADYAAGLTYLLVAIERQAKVGDEKGGRAEIKTVEQALKAVKAAVLPAVATPGAQMVQVTEVAATQDVDALVTAVKEAVAEEGKKEARDVAKKAGAGYLPLRLRARHSLTAAWLNTAVQLSQPERSTAVDMAARNYGRLVRLLKTAKDLRRPSEDVFYDEMSRVACALKRAFDLFVQAGCDPGLPDPPRFRKRSSLESPHVLYDDACRLAFLAKNDEALAMLERAAGLEDNRKDARTDPWFEPIRSLPDPGNEARAKTVRRFWDIVGPEPLAFTELPVFGQKGADLANVGVTSAPQMFAATGSDDERKDLAKVLEVPLGVVSGWRELSELAAPNEPCREWLTPRHLHVLAAAGVRSLTDLKCYVQSPGDLSALQALLTGEAERLGVAPLDKNELEEVASRAGVVVSGGVVVSSDGAVGPRGGFFRR